MLARLRLLPLLAAALLLSGCRLNWEEYTSKEGGYSVKFPGKVKTQTQTVPTTAGPLTFHAAGTEGKDNAYMVMYANIPRGAKKNFDYLAAIKAMVATWRGSLNYQRGVTVEGVSGMEFEANVTWPGKGRAACRIFVYKKKVYILGALGANIKADSDDVKEFYSSFKLAK